MRSSTKYPSQVPYDWHTRRRYLDLPFPMSEYNLRLRRIKTAMAKQGVDALMIFGDAGDPGDLVYVSNFVPFGRATLFLPIDGQPIIVTDAILHGEPINSYSWMTWVQDFRPARHDPSHYARELAECVRQFRAKNIGLVGRDNAPISIWQELSPICGDARWLDFSVEFTTLKSIRSPREVELLREIGRNTADAMDAAIASISPGRTESDVAAVANYTMIRGGAHSGSAIVNSGPKSGLKHSYPTSRKIAKGDMVYLDLGAVRFGYQSDMSRTVVVGGASAQQREVLDVIETAFETVSGMMRPGVKVSRLLAKADELADRSGLREKYRGRIYLGLMVHHAIATSFFEVPSLGQPDTVLRKNMSFAFEPMAHILDFGTAVIEDCLLVTSDGVESLTPLEKVHW